MSRPDEVDPDFAALVDEVFGDYAAAMAADAPLDAADPAFSGRLESLGLARLTTPESAGAVARPGARRRSCCAPRPGMASQSRRWRRTCSEALSIAMRGGCAVRNAHQVHGAIGTTREHVLHRVTIPILAWTNDFGSVAEWDALIEQTARDAGDVGLWELVSGTSAATGAPS